MDFNHPPKNIHLIINIALFLFILIMLSLIFIFYKTIFFLQFDFGIISYFALIFLFILLIFQAWAIKHIGIKANLSYEPLKLVTTGPYRYVRHPVYLFDILCAFSLFLYFGHFVIFLALLCITLMQLLHLHFEEKEMENKFGQKYRDYAKHTDLIFPKFS